MSIIMRIVWAYNSISLIQAAVERETNLGLVHAIRDMGTIANARANSSALDSMANHTVYTGPGSAVWNSTHMGKMNDTAWVLNDDVMGRTDLHTVMSRGVGFYKNQVSYSIVTVFIVENDNPYTDTIQKKTIDCIKMEPSIWKYTVYYE